MSRNKKPLTEKQLAANRANAARSTGPVTPEGKARSSQNARKHGFASSDYTVVRMEDLDAVEGLETDLIAVYQPVNSQELFAINRIAQAQLALIRAARLDAGIFTACINEALSPRTGQPFQPMEEMLTVGLEVTQNQNRNYALAQGFRKVARESNAITLMLRYQAQAERHYRRAIEEFERLKSKRSELPTEPISPDEPEQNEPDPPPETNPNEESDGAPAPSGINQEGAARASAPPPPSPRDVVASAPEARQSAVAQRHPSLAPDLRPPSPARPQHRHTPSPSPLPAYNLK